MTYVVVKGDSLTRIARRHGVSQRAITAVNHIPNPDLVRIGQVLRIPGAAAAAGEPAPSAPTRLQHMLAQGETLTSVARRYGTSIATIASLNGIEEPDRVRAGRVLLVPGPPAAAVTTRAGAHDIERLLVGYSRRYGVDPNLVKAIAWQESGWKQSVVSRTGAVGVMQVQPATGEFASEILFRAPVDLSDVEHNVRTGVRFLAYLFDQVDGSQTYAVAAYYQGLRSVRERGLYDETRRYIANVAALKKRFARAG